MGKKGQAAIAALVNEMVATRVRELVAEQTRARVMIAFDAALIACNKTFHMGPGRAAEFSGNYHEAMEWLASLYIADCDDNGDDRLEYAKAKRDELLLRIVGPENFVPFDKAYGQAYMDELKRIRVMQAAAEGQDG